MTLGALPAEAVIPVLTSLANAYGIPLDALMAAYPREAEDRG